MFWQVLTCACRSTDNRSFLQVGDVLVHMGPTAISPAPVCGRHRPTNAGSSFQAKRKGKIQIEFRILSDDGKSLQTMVKLAIVL